MALLGRIPKIFIVVILSQCVVCSNDAAKPTEKTHEHKSPPVIPEVYTLKCINETLYADKYEIFPNSTVYVKKYDAFLNSSSYVLNNNSITVCKSPIVLLQDRFTVCFFFAFIVFMTHAQIPIVLCFGPMSRLFLLFVCSMPIATLFSTAISSTYFEFASEMKTTIAVLTFINVSTLGWMTFLSSDYILKILEGRNAIEITNSKIILKKLTVVAQMGLIVGTVLGAYSFVMLSFGAAERLLGIEFIDRIEGDKMLIFFAIPIVLFMFTNLLTPFVNFGSRYYKFKKSASVMLEDIRLQHRKYFVCYIGSIFMWLCGYYSLIFDYCLAWYCFVVVNVVLPIYWLCEIMTFKNIYYDVAIDYVEEDCGYTVLFKLGKKTVKLDFDYSGTQTKR